MELSKEQSQVLDNLFNSGASPAEIIEVMFEYFKLSLPAGDPVRTANERIGFKTKPEREALDYWEYDKSLASQWAILGHKFLHTPDTELLRARLANLLTIIVEDGHTSILQQLIKAGAEFDEFQPDRDNLPK